jgi:hypothetical protein
MKAIQFLLSQAAVVFIFGAAIMPSAQAAVITYTITSGLLNQGPPGAAGQYTLDGVTTTFSSDAIATFTATADSTSVVSATSSSDSGSVMMYYNLVGSIGITIVDGSTTMNFNAGAQGSLLPAAVSFRDLAGSYSAIGFGVVDINSPYTPENPHLLGFGYELILGNSFYNNLQSPEIFNGPYQFVPVGTMQVTSGSKSGTLELNNAGSSPSFSITAAPIPEPSCFLLALLGAAPILRRRRVS